jgi:hypothetical protein
MLMIRLEIIIVLFLIFNVVYSSESFRSKAQTVANPYFVYDATFTQSLTTNADVYEQTHILTTLCGMLFYFLEFFPKLF